MKIIQTMNNGQPVCAKCAMGEFVKVSRQYRPLVSQWVSFGEARVPNAVRVECLKCHCWI